MRTALFLALALIAAASVTVAQTSSPPPAERACVFPSGRGATDTCSPFATVGIRIVSSFPNAAFGKNIIPEDIAVLDNGTVLVHTRGNGLYRIVSGHITALRHEPPPCGPHAGDAFSFMSALNNQVLVALLHPSFGWIAGIRSDGSTAFRWPPPQFQLDKVVQDPSGIIWTIDPSQAIAAFDPRTQRVTPLDMPEKPVTILRSPDGRVYASGWRSLYLLQSSPTVRAQKVHDALANLSGYFGWIQAVGGDGSLWASSLTEVVHVHADGSAVRLQLAPRPIVSRNARNIDLSMAPDGAVWTADRSVRIGADGWITRVARPKGVDGHDVHFGPNSTLWAIVRDSATDEPEGIVEFAPGTSSQRIAAWPLRAAPVATATPVVTCTPSPAPQPPLPPRTGSVYYAYAVADDPSAVWGYWAGPDGTLHPLRGSPYTMGGSSKLDLTISPNGRFVYVGSWYDGVYAFAINPISGGLRQIAGSPFDTGTGPNFVTIDSSDRFAYVNNLNAKTVGIYSIDGNTGALSPVAGSPFHVDQRPFRIALNPKRDIVYVLLDGWIATYSGADKGFELLATTKLTYGESGGNAFVVDRAGRWAYVANNSQSTVAKYPLDPRTGVFESSSSLPVMAGREARFLAIAREQFLYVSNIWPDDNLLGFSIDRRNGDLSGLEASPFAGAESPQKMAVTPDGAFLYVTNFGSASVAAFAISPQTGALTSLKRSPFPSGKFPGGIAACMRVRTRCMP